ncbi:MAG: Hpt domain-containing protein, partial [Nitrososphaerales archaeon]
GPDDETLAAVAKILIEELRDITDRLDLYVRASEPNVSNLVKLLPDLEQVSNTLVVVGLQQHQQAISKQLEIIRGVEESGTPPDEETLLDMAKDLLEMEAVLGSFIGESDDGSVGESFGDLDEAQAAVVRETRIGLAQCRDALIEFVSSDFDHSKLENLPDDLSVLKGGLLIVNQERSGDVLIAASRYVKESLLKDKVRPELSDIDNLADAITSVDYYLERLLQSTHDPYIQMIEVAEAAVEKLGFKVGEQAPAVPEEAEVKTEEVEEEIVEDDRVEAEEAEEPEPEIESEPETVEATDDVDDEILEIFVEEVDEVLETIAEYFPQWQADFESEEALEGLKRAFHTLKGSGRMVGATALGDLAWSIEDMLNQVIDNSIQPGTGMVSLIADVIASVPEGLGQFKNQNQQAFKVDEMIARAEAITAGEEAPAADVAPAAEAPVEEAPVEEAPAEKIFITEAAETEDAAAEEALVSEEIEIGEVPDTEEAVQATVEELASAESIEDFNLEDLEIDEEIVDQPATVEDDVADELDDIALDSADILETQEEVAETEVEDEVIVEEEADQEAAAIGTTAAGLTADDLLESDDFELDDIFVAEANELIEVIQQFLGSPGEVSGDLVAAFHTLKGSSAMAEIPSITTIAAPLEQLASQYLTQGSAPDAGFINAIDNGIGLIKAIVANLAEFRDSIEGNDTQVAEIKAAQISSPETIAEFNFENIKLLSEEEVVSSNWQEDHVVAVVAELNDAQEQANALGQSELQELTTSLLRVYGKLQTTPDETVISALKSAHERLVIIFDRIAASQDVAKAADDITTLDALEVGEAEEVEEAEEIEGAGEAADDVPTTAEGPPGEALPEDDIDEDILPIFLEETEELLEGIDQSILDWSEDTSSMGSLDILLRHLHTLKGGARMAGLNSLGEFTHNFE